MRRKSVLKNQSVVRRKRTKSAARKSKDSVRILLTLAGRVGLFALRIFFFIGVLFIISGAFLYSYKYLMVSPYFRLERIVVKGVDGALAKELKRICRGHGKETLISINLGVLKEKMEGIPWIRRAELERRFPHTLIIYAEKQVPCALLLTDSRFYYLNRRAEPFLKVDGVPSLDLPVITCKTIDMPEFHERLVSAVNIISLLGNKRWVCSSKNLSEIHVHENGDLSLFFDGIPAEVKIGLALTSRDTTSIGKDILVSRFRALDTVARKLKQMGRIDYARKIYLYKTDDVVVSFKG